MILRPRYNGPQLPTTYAVNMTAAASGSSGIVVADSDEYDFSKTDFTVFWEGDFFDFDAAVHLQSKIGTGVMEMVVLSSGQIRMNVRGSLSGGIVENVDSTVGVTLPRGFFAITYEHGSPNDTLRFYWNASKLGTDVATTAKGDLSGAGDLNISGRTTGIRELSDTIRAGVLNFKLSDAQVAQLYSSGIPAEWMWGSNVELTSGSLVVGALYRINHFETGDDFTNVGAASNADGVEFTATGTTPTTWSNGSALVTLGATMALLPDTIPTSSATTWSDTSGNTGGGTLPAAGATKVTIRR